MAHCNNSTLYQTALENIFDEMHLETPGFKCFSRYAKHNSSFIHDAMPIDLSMPKKEQRPTQTQKKTEVKIEEDNNIQEEKSNVLPPITAPAANFNFQTWESTPKRAAPRIRQFNLFAEYVKIALLTKPPPVPENSLTPRSLERKKLMDLMDLRQKTLLESKKTRRTSLRV